MFELSMKIRFVHPASVRLTFAPGDEVVVAPSAEVTALLASSRLDGERVAVVVEDESDVEFATVGRGRARQRSAAVS